MKELWKKFNIGNSLTTQELKRLKQSAESGLEYLMHREEYLAAAKTAQDIARIDSYLYARKHNL